MSMKVFVSSVCCFLVLGALVPRADGSETHFSIAAANLSSQTGPIDTCYTVHAGRIFEGVAPDIVAMQEFNVTNNGDYASHRDFVDQHFGTNFHYYVEDKLMPNGVISRWPIVEAGWWDDAELSDREFVWATIQIPGERLLHVISVHLKATGSQTASNDLIRRMHQARQLTNYIANAFSSTNFVALCGDFNLVDRAESTLHILTNDFPYTHTPKDQFGYKDTNSGRNKPYDWVMPNALLNAYSTTTYIDGVAFPEGAIFDSRVWDSPPSPILPDDSSAPGIQHMLVVRTFSFTVTSPPPDRAMLAHYTFEGSSGGTNTAAVAQPGVIASPFDTRTGSFRYFQGDSSDYALATSGWNDPFFSHYFTFTVSIGSGYHALLNALQFDALRGGTGPTRWAVRSSLDGFEQNLSAGEFPLQDAWSQVYIGLGLNLISGQITFRIYGCDAETSHGNWRLDNVSVQGTIREVERFLLRAVAMQDSVLLRWPSPEACGYPGSRVRLVYNATHYPTNAADGTSIELDDGSTSYLHTNCVPGVTQFYTIWVHDGSDYVEPAP